jgi:hypothetical protein
MFWTRGLAALLMVGAATAVGWAQTRPDTTGWKTFRKPAMGFELQHPSSWGEVRITSANSETVMLSQPSQGGKPALVIQVWVQRKMNPRGLTIEQWYADQLSRVASPPQYPTTRTTLGGRPALLREAVGTLSRSFDFFVVLNKVDVFQVTISQEIPQTELDQAYVAILSTLKFLD